jgi:segregation and condensation protein A
MDFKDLLPADNEEIPESKSEDNSEKEKIGPNQVYGIITSKRPDWKGIIYELVDTEQLDPWDIDIVLLTNRYFEKLHELENADFYISSKVLLAASLLLRIKSELLYNKHLKSIDDILFNRQEEEKKTFEKIEIEEDELPILIPKTPLPRARRVTLNELMSALNKAINTESRRIRREVAVKRAERLSEVDFPKITRIDLKDRIKQFYARILTYLRKPAKPDKDYNKVGYSKLVGQQREERLAAFLPVLHLSNTKKLWLEQEKHLDEIWIFLHRYFEKNKDLFIEELEEDIESMEEELAGENVEGKSESGLEKARKRLEEKKRLQEEIAKELENEIGIISHEEEVEDATGFSQEN